MEPTTEFGIIDCMQSFDSFVYVALHTHPLHHNVCMYVYSFVYTCFVKGLILTSFTDMVNSHLLMKCFHSACIHLF